MKQLAQSRVRWRVGVVVPVRIKEIKKREKSKRVDKKITKIFTSEHKEILRILYLGMNKKCAIHLQTAVYESIQTLCMGKGLLTYKR